MGLPPVRAVTDLDDERDVEREDALHQLGDARAERVREAVRCDPFNLELRALLPR